MDYFQKTEIDLLNNYAGQQKTDELHNVYESLKSTYNKIEYWAVIVKENLYKDGIVKIIKKPTNQANKFEFYHWAKIYPTKDDLNNKILAFTLSIENNGKFVIKIDTVGLVENSSIRKKYYDYRKNNPIVKEYTFDDFNNWDELIIRSINEIKALEPYFEELKEFLDLNSLNNNVLDQNMNKLNLNQILYGPPGTGKTYNTINKAIEIANPEFNLTQDRNTIKQEYNRLVENGQIVFTTFHQSMTYEDFIEGIKPETKDNNVIYNIKNGLFKEIVSKSIDNWKKSTSGTKQTKPFDKVFQLLKDEWEENPMIEFPMKREGNDFKILGFSDSSISFLKASGTNNHTLSINTLRDLYYGIREFQNQGVGIYYPSIVDKLNSYDISFESESINSDIKNFVIVIDEINRGNVSQIFGELITLIEEDKRLGNDEAIEVILPYSKEKFGVPSNLYIIGTMNTADRSVEALDTALRRRFVFEEMPPKYELDGLQQQLYGYKAADILQRINLRIEKLLDRDHQIGHAYFLNKDENTIITSFYKNIIPLLQEYFFGDYGKIGLVLGAGFVDLNKQDHENQSKSIFASFGYENDISAYEERKSYKILGLNDKDFDFGSAIKLLMNK